MGLALLSGFSMAALFTYVSSATFVFQEGFGLSAQQFALIFASGAVCITAGTQINGALIGRWPPERILTVGVFAGLGAAGSMLTVAFLGLGMWPLIATLLLTLLFIGVLLPAVPVIALEANAHRAGSAAALLGAMQFGVGAAVAPITGLFPEGSPGGDGGGDVRRHDGDGWPTARTPAGPEARPATDHGPGRIRFLGGGADRLSRRSPYSVSPGRDDPQS